MKRRKFVLARLETSRERFGAGYPHRFYAGRNRAGRIVTRHDLCGGVAFFYESPLLRMLEDELKSKGFRVLEILVVNPETRS